MFQVLSALIPMVLTVLSSAHVRASISRGTIADHLRHPSFQTRVDRIRREGDIGFRGLRDIAFDKASPERMKWNAIVSMGVVYGHRADSDLEKALKSDDWILRNAAQVAMRSYNPVRSKEWALKLLKDKALVVRSASVDMLSQDPDDHTISSLWQAFNDPMNFRGNRSLWIRKQILQVIAAHPRNSDASRFVGVLRDKDAELHLPAVRALERITGMRKGSEGSLRDQSRLWLKWWDTQVY